MKTDKDIPIVAIAKLVDYLYDNELAKEDNSIILPSAKKVANWLHKISERPLQPGSLHKISLRPDFKA